jgi:transcription elongation GreA/GreB family factor
LALIERDLSAAAAEHEAALSRGDRAAIARTAREWRYWTSRRGSEKVVMAPGKADAVRFGSTVTISRDDGRVQTFQIVGEDEADPGRNSLPCFTLGARANEKQHGGRGACDAEILRIE